MGFGVYLGWFIIFRAIYKELRKPKQNCLPPQQGVDTTQRCNDYDALPDYYDGDVDNFDDFQAQLDELEERLDDLEERYDYGAHDDFRDYADDEPDDNLDRDW